MNHWSQLTLTRRGRPPLGRHYVGLIVMAVFTLITYGVHWANARKTKAASDDSHTDA